MLGQLVRIRHGRGFGVHSPLAYELITSVLRDKPAYYADNEIETFGLNRRQRRIARIIFRLLVRFGAETVSVPPPYDRVPALASGSITTSSRPDMADMTVTVSDGRTEIRIGHAETDTGPLILENGKDLRITVFRKGLSPVTVNTTL